MFQQWCDQYQQGECWCRKPVWILENEEMSERGYVIGVRNESTINPEPLIRHFIPALITHQIYDVLHIL